jgi:hypothetical protein
MRFDLGGSILFAIVDVLVPLVKGFFRGYVENIVSTNVMSLFTRFNTAVKT